MAGWGHHATVATLPAPATANRTGACPSYGLPTTCSLALARSRAAYASCCAGCESPGAAQCLEGFGGGTPLPGCSSPRPHALRPIAVPGLALRGRVAHPASVAPAPDARVEVG